MLFSLFRGLLVIVVGAATAARTSRPPGGNYARGNREPPCTMANMTCSFFQQPLNHFDLPRNQSGFYQQRYCYYDKFASASASAPVFFYTGNESPLDEYINHTGLIWELAPKFNAHVFFVEHRYEGESLPSPDSPRCLAYASSYQALADFANFIQNRVFSQGRRPVIVFGGSYGGMLSAWMRMLYPHLVVGAIAGSAPIGGFPTNRPTAIDAAYQVITHGLKQSYPPTATATTGDDDDDNDENHCPDNFLAAWPLIEILAREATGRALLEKSFKLCHALPYHNAAARLTSWAQSPWFDLAEGSFPYPSDYVTFALTKNPSNLPAWPLQAACWNQSALHQDWQLEFTGNRSDVLYNISYGDSGLTIAVDWDTATAIFPCDSQEDCWKDSIVESNTIRGLLESLRDAVSVWYNVSKDVQCYNLTAAPNQNYQTTNERFVVAKETPIRADRVLRTPTTSLSSNATEKCHRRMQHGSWPSLCCNEEMNLIITEAFGLGKDVFWPPSHPRGTRTYADTIDDDRTLYSFCLDPDGIFGFPQESPDPWATWMDIRYGGLHLSAHSNIVFSNGLLDPWSAAGVYSKNGDPSKRGGCCDPDWQPYQGIKGLYVQNITHDDRMIALILEYGGHHTDLMFSHPLDPPSVTAARQVESNYIARWIQSWEN